jgi:hypothetical protein
MHKADGPWIGRLGLRLVLAFVGVALAAIVSLILLGSLTMSREINQLVERQQFALTHATAVAAADAYDHVGWSRADLTPQRILSPIPGRPCR